MTRVGYSPDKGAGIKEPPPPAVSVCVVTHYTEHPYHAKRMEVVEASLGTMCLGAKASGKKYELIIWDNGSTFQFRMMLKQHFPDVYIESPNYGPYHARRALCRIARAPIISLADDDILYSPDWLEEQIKILATYPHVALVSGSPMNVGFRRGIEANLKFAAQPDVKHVSGRNLIPDQWEVDYSASVGHGHENKRAYEEHLLEYQGVKAWAHGHHMQMLGYREILTPLMDALKPYGILEAPYFNDIPDAAGWLQLSTYQRTARHIGNVLDEEMRSKPWKVQADVRQIAVR